MGKSDNELMRRALELAAKGAGLVSPNPMVGAVIVAGGKIVGEGYHRFDRLRHAESYALEQAGERARAATLYCNLEPCCHHGRTPPCTDAVIAAGVSRAVISIADPDPRVSGRGIGQLQEAGIVVDLGICAEEARCLNEAYLKFVSTGQPFLHAILFHGARDRGDLNRKAADWIPSAGLWAVAANYDAIVLGADDSVNAAFLKNLSEAEPAKRPMIFGTVEQIERISLVTQNYDCRLAIYRMEQVELSARPRLEQSSAGAGRSSDVTTNACDAPAFANRQSTELLDELLKSKATSALILPSAAAEELSKTADKITLVEAPDLVEEAVQLDQPFAADLAGVQVNPTGRFVEITGYPRKR